MGAFNGSGTFVRTYDWTTDEGNGVNIEASRMDTEDDGFATGLSTCITKDGQTTITANIPFNSKKITGLTNGSARTDSIALGQVQDNTYEYLGENGGAADAYTWTPSPTITAYKAGQSWIVKIGSGDGNTGASTANISALGTRSIVKSDGAGSTTALESGDMVAGGFYKLIDTGSALLIQNPEKPYLNSANFINNNFTSNLIINGDFKVGRSGATFDSTTTPANNDDTYLLDQWILLSDGNDIVDVSRETSTVPTGSYSALKIDQETANKQWAFCQILEARDAAAIIGGTASLSFKARKGGSNATLETLRAAIISWSSTADSVTSDVIATWNGAGTNPSLATNWTYENIPSNLTLTTSYQTFTIENISIDTASTANVAVLIWCDDTDATVGDLAYITDVKLEKNSVATNFVPRPYEEELQLSQRFFEVMGEGEVVNEPFSIGHCTSATTASAIVRYRTKKRSIPSISFSNVTHFNISTAAANKTSTNIATVGANGISSSSCGLVVTTATGLGTNDACYFSTSSTSARIYIDSRL